MNDVVTSSDKNVGLIIDGFSPAIKNANAMTEKKKVSAERTAEFDCILPEE
jgi:hypothetical protein